MTEKAVARGQLGKMQVKNTVWRVQDLGKQSIRYLKADEIRKAQPFHKTGNSSHPLCCSHIFIEPGTEARSSCSSMRAYDRTHFLSHGLRMECLEALCERVQG